MLHRVIQTESEDVANGADVNHKGSDTGLALTPLHLAAVGNQTEIARFLIDKGDHLDTQGVTVQLPAPGRTWLKPIFSPGTSVLISQPAPEVKSKSLPMI